ncbi:MAG: hypothetical protein RL708_2266 [Bacteroidota bacterium]|jgi:bacillithiol synthase
MQLSYLPLQATHQFSKFIIEYAVENKLFHFLDADYFNNSYIKKTIESRKHFSAIQRNELADILVEQNSFLSLDESVLHNIKLLRNNNCFTITTAHQPCLFTGPIYTIVKAISAIKLAQQYKKDFPENDFIPVFYIGSEDHDLDELNHLNLFNKKINWQTNQSGAVGSMNLAGIDEVINEIENLLQNEVRKDEIIAVLKKCYRPEYSMSKAFRCLLNELLGSHGLVILDANEPRLKKHFKPIIKDELINQNSNRLLNDENWLANFENNQLQITPREINLFYLDNNSRERIIQENETWKVNNTNLKFSKHEIENLLETNPEKFSPNVVLRALYQNTILPDIAFIGGGSEVTYWLQIKTVFDYYKIDFPKIELRDSIFWIDEQAEQKRLKWDFEVADIFKNVNDLIVDFTEKNGGLNVDVEIETIKTKIAELNEKIKLHDKTYEPISLAVATQINNQFENLQKKLLQADKKKLSDSIQQIQKWREKLLPENHLHERHDNFISYFLKYGNQFVETLVVHLTPQNKNIKVFTQ